MRQLIFCFLLFTQVTTVTAEVTPSLNSDVIRERFGSYGVEVLSQNDELRVANLFSGEGNSKVSRTLAVTVFVLPRDSRLDASDQVIRAGGSIGASLRNAGFVVDKRVLLDTEVTTGSGFVALSNNTVGTRAQLKTRVYALYAVEGNEAIPYAVIAEAYHPEHAPPPFDERTTDPILVDSAEKALQHLKALMQEVAVSPAA